jgi:hypothetical protein
MNARLMELIGKYREKFDEGPPIWEVPEDEAIRLIEEALETGKEIRDEDVTPPDLPPDALL